MAQNYTRQSSFNDGDTITASLFNDEYNQLVNAFTYSSTSASSTGHRHDGSAGQGGNIFKIGDLDFLNKIEVDSTNNRWGFYVEVSSAAVEQIRIQDGSVVPVTTNDIDLGTASLQFKDLYIDGTANVDSLTLTSGSTVTTILDEDDMSSDSDTALVTQQSVKAYVDAQVTAQDFDFQADTGGALSIDLDSETMTFTGGTGIDTSGALNEVTFAIDSTVATLTGTQTLTNKTLTSPDIDGGTIDGTVIGGTTPAAVSATTVSATGNITVGGTVDGRDVATDGTKLDGIESGATADQTAAEIRTLVDSATDSNVFTDADHSKLDGIEAGATGDQTNAEIRAAVEAATDSNVFTDADHSKLDGIEALADVTDTTNVTAAGALMDSELTDITAVKSLDQGVATTDTPSFTGLTTTADVSFGDNNKAIFGAGSDLQIYHDGSTSFIDDVGTGNLHIRTDGASIKLRTSANADMIVAENGGAAKLYHAGSQKLTTLTTGIDVTGTVTADGLDVNTATGSATPTATELKISSSTNASDWSTTDNWGVLGFYSADGSGGGAGNRAEIAINMETATGAFGSLDFTLANPGNTYAQSSWLKLENSASSASRKVSVYADNGLDVKGGDVSFYEDTGTTAKFFWDASAESLGIGTSSPAAPIAVQAGSAGTAVASFKNAGFFGLTITPQVGGSGGVTDIRLGAGESLSFSPNNTEAMRVTSTGIDVTGTVTADGLTVDAGSTDEVARFEGTGSPYISWYDTGVRQGYIGSFGNTFSIVGDTPDTTVAIGTGGTTRATIDSTGIDVTGTVTADGGTIVSTSSNAFSSKAVGGYAIQAYQDATSADHTALDLRSDATTGTRYLIRGYNDAAGTPTEVFSVGADGTVTADGLTVDGNLSVDGGTIKLDGNYPTGTENVALGDTALDSVQSDGVWNVAIGSKALTALTSGDGNVAVGRIAMESATTAIQNTAVGYGTLQALTTASNNTAVGYQALAANTTGASNVAVGTSALQSNTTASNNIGIGVSALSSNTTGGQNVAVGDNALATNITGLRSTAVGYWALRQNTASDNTALGYASLTSNTSGANNTAVGRNALNSNTTGSTSTAVGTYALDANTTGINNNAFGVDSLGSNTTGNYNNAFGEAALLSNTTGASNIAMGGSALRANTTASNNTGIGESALRENTTGPSNVAVGANALRSNTTATGNTAVGEQSAYSNTTGASLAAFGRYALYANSTGANNTGLGFQALFANTTASNNTAVGYQALYSTTTGGFSTAVGGSALRLSTGLYNDAFGYVALTANTTGTNNNAFGGGALESNTTGSYNTALGRTALYSNTTSSNNTAVGYQALYANVSSANNTALGYFAGQDATSANNVFIGKDAGLQVTSGANNTYVGFGSGPNSASGTGGNNTTLGYLSGNAITSGAKNTIIGAFTGNQGGLDIRTSNNHIVLSDGDGNPRIVVDSSGNVGIGSVSPSNALDVQSLDGTTVAIEMQGGDGNSKNLVFRKASAIQGQIRTVGDALEFGIGSSATERMRISANGVSFNGDTAAANCLDDYEEGTWTPALEASTTNPTPTAVTVNNATYTKVGRMVHVQAYITVNLTSVGSGGAQITGLPFTVGTGYAPVLFTHGDLILSSGGYFNNGSTKIIAITNNSTSSIGYAGTGTKVLMISGTYEVA